MKKSLLVIMSVAILGGLGLYINKPETPKIADTTASTPITAADTTTQSSSSTSGTTPASSAYKDGTYAGDSADTIYGTVQVAAVVSGGKITDIQFLQMPSDQQNSQVVTAMAEPGLKSSALSKQSAQIDFVSGATSTSEGFEQSLQAALDKAAA